MIPLRSPPADPAMLTTRVSLLERLRQTDDEAAWTRFVELYTPLLLRWCQRQNIPANDAADLVQEVMLLLVRKFNDFQYDTTRSFRAWLRTVFLNKQREMTRRPSPTTLSEPSTFIEFPAPTDDDEQADRQLLLNRGLELIRPEFNDTAWRAFWEYAINNRPVADVARELSISVGSVYTAKCRVLARLRLELDFDVE